MVDLMVRGSSVLYMEDKILKGWRHFGRPCALQHGGASCIHTGVERGTPEMASDRLTQLSAQVPFGFVLEVPDAHSANSRKQEKSKLKLPDKIGLLCGKCGSHQAHRVIATRGNKSLEMCMLLL